MKADAKRIIEVFSRQSILQIPYFQRRYVWRKEDWERFAIDMESTIDTLNKYFLGAIILKEEGELQDNFMVIDGQQRLTTFTLYMKALHLLTSRNFDNYLQDTDRKAPILIHCCEDLPIYTEIMHLETVRIISQKGNIADAFNYFYNTLDDARNKRNINLDLLRKEIEKKVWIVNITLQTGDDEQQIFDTINSLGVPLTTGELMKNFLYKANDEEKYNNTWKKVFDVKNECDFWELDRAKNRQQKDSKTSNIEIFFHAFVRIKMWDFKDELSNSQRKNFVKASNVFSTCKAFVELFGMERQELADEIIAYAKLFRNNFDMGILDEHIPSYSSIKRIACLVNATKSHSVISYLLYVLKNVEQESERNLIFGYIETYLIRRMLAEGENKSYSEFFSESLISNKLLSYAALKQFVESKDQFHNLAMPNDVRVKMGITLRSKSIEENTARILYYMYESKVRTAQDVHIQGFNDYQAEMLMPKPSAANTTNWPRLSNRDDEEERLRLIGTLGNYYLMNSSGGKKLKKIKDDAFVTKKEIFKKYSLANENEHSDSNEIRCNQILNNTYSWKKDDINSRNLGLTSVFCNIFKIE